MNKIKVARIIEEEIDKVDTKILYLTFPSSKHLNYLFTPKLENISFVRIDRNLAVNLKNSLFREFFNEWVIRFMKKINKLYR